LKLKLSWLHWMVEPVFRDLGNCLNRRHTRLNSVDLLLSIVEKQGKTWVSTESQAAAKGLSYQGWARTTLSPLAIFQVEPSTVQTNTAELALSIFQLSTAGH